MPSTTDYKQRYDPRTLLAWILCALIFGLMLIAKIQAAGFDDAQKCIQESQRGNLDEAIILCTRAIGSGQLSDPDRAITFNNRGNVYSSKKNYAQAIQDYDQAIRIRPNYPEAFNNRGYAYYHQQDYDRAINNYDQAVKLNPKYAKAFNNRAEAYVEKRQYERALGDYEAAAAIGPQFARYKSIGFTLFYLGRIEKSAEAIGRAVQASPEDTYAILWRYLTRAKNGALQLASVELGNNAAKLKGQSWPLAVIDFYLGKSGEKAVYEAASHLGANTKNEQLCEANFYVAEAKLLGGNSKNAVPLLRTALKDCPPTSTESHAAESELKRLEQR
ncbi:MAG TPA: tetratricopeptide repeat protein [Candidatus Acidoferrales bacterium]|nr:tetratricopeptide repeat protein [Candidatus Acidoferrales bacterium]